MNKIPPMHNIAMALSTYSEHRPISCSSVSNPVDIPFPGNRKNRQAQLIPLASTHWKREWQEDFYSTAHHDSNTTCMETDWDTKSETQFHLELNEEAVPHLQASEHVDLSAKMSVTDKGGNTEISRADLKITQQKNHTARLLERLRLLEAINKEYPWIIPKK